jgi:PadR family transcriptional regulator, regulatory protein PadR
LASCLEGDAVRAQRSRTSAKHSILIVCIDTIRVMSGVERVTWQLLALLEALLDAYVRDQKLHGYALMKRAKLSGPSTYRNLDRLEEASLVTIQWEELPPGDERPRRCFYSLNTDGVAKARELLAERNPQALERIGRMPPDPLRPGWATFLARVRPAARGTV